MKLLDLTLPTPEDNLACDEALLDYCEAVGGDEVLRFWEPRQYFVVLGYANKTENEVDLVACTAENIPVFRRCSGGGTVLQGPGCLNYSLILGIDEAGPLHSISSTNCFVMKRQQEALRAILDKPIEVKGHTDLALENLKFSGNAQRRHKNHLLFHGTFLVDFDLPLIGKFLHQPARQPQYRQNRSHENFLRNLNADSASIKKALRTAWQATEPWQVIPTETINKLVTEKYSRREWNLRF